MSVDERLSHGKTGDVLTVLWKNRRYPQFCKCDISGSSLEPFICLLALWSIISPSFSASPILGAEVSDGIWHVVQWRREGASLVVAVDDVRRKLAVEFYPYRAHFNTTIKVYVGAQPLTPGMHSQLVS